MASGLDIPKPSKSYAPAHGLSTDEIKSISRSCIEAKARAYCPYSHFRVGAALLLQGDSSTGQPGMASTSPQIITGANVENAAYPSGACAERVAIDTAVVSFGVRRGGIRALGVATDAKDPSSPCGFCRQVLREFCELDMPIFMHDREGRYVVLTLEQLLPMSFGPDSLPPPDELDKARQEMGEK